MGLNRLVVVAGPTGTGKSDLALDLAEQLDGEVVNSDSMQLYRGMDIGTAKLPAAERRGVPHHLLDVLDVSERASVAKYQRAARERIEDILARSRTPVLVGGSGLYISAVVDDIEFPGIDPVLRAQLAGELAAVGPAVLYRRLQLSDPAAAAAIEPGNGRRLVRALEVIAVTGRPFTATMPLPGPPRYGAALIYLDRDTAALDQRLEQRVLAMVEAGFLDEVRGLDQRGLRGGVTASRALGYRQMLAVLDRRTDLDTAVAETIRLTRRFVRRQRSWFRRDSRLRRFDAASADLTGQVVEFAGSVSAGGDATTRIG
jgi:tRNA dimethylallyltransferase